MQGLKDDLLNVTEAIVQGSDQPQGVLPVSKGLAHAEQKNCHEGNPGPSGLNQLGDPQPLPFAGGSLVERITGGGIPG